MPNGKEGAGKVDQKRQPKRENEEKCGVTGKVEEIQENQRLYETQSLQSVQM